jgi:hypothetical protein
VSLSLLAMIASNGSPDALDTVRLSLEASSEWWFALVKYSGYAVAFGCALEAPETFVIIKRWWLLKFRGEEREETIEDKKKWDVPLAAVGLLVIVLGIFLETYAEGKVSDIDARIRSHESDKITAAESAAGAAIKKAADANGRASDNEKEAAQLRKDAADLEDSISWRRISSDKRSSIAARLRSYVGQFAWITYNMNDVESNDFGVDIAATLKLAHWIPTEPEALLKMFEGPAQPGTNKLPRGIVVKSTPDSSSENAAKVLVKELVNAGFDATNALPVPLGTAPGQAKGVDAMRASGAVVGQRPTVFVSVEPRPDGPQGDAKLRAARKKQQTSTQTTKQ